jgi:hypothetical protein
MAAIGLRQVASWVGVAVLVLVIWPYAFIGLVAPWWMVPVMLVVWALLLAAALANFKERPFLVLAMPVIALVIWVAVVSAGDVWFDWTA